MKLEPNGNSCSYIWGTCEGEITKEQADGQVGVSRRAPATETYPLRQLYAVCGGHTLPPSVIHVVCWLSPGRPDLTVSRRAAPAAHYASRTRCPYRRIYLIGTVLSARRWRHTRRDSPDVIYLVFPSHTNTQYRRESDVNADSTQRPRNQPSALYRRPITSNTTVAHPEDERWDAVCCPLLFQSILPSRCDVLVPGSTAYGKMLTRRLAAELSAIHSARVAAWGESRARKAPSCDSRWYLAASRWTRVQAFAVQVGLWVILYLLSLCY